MRSKNAVRVLIALLCLLSSTLLSAQSTGGRILGRVSDPTGAILAGVKITATNESTGVSRDIVANESGDYVFMEVQPGQYSLKFEHEGFTTALRKGVTLEVNQVITLN